MTGWRKELVERTKEAGELYWENSFTELVLRSESGKKIYSLSMSLVFDVRFDKERVREEILKVLFHHGLLVDVPPIPDIILAKRKNQ